jgi:hypothetical protein
MDNVTSLPTAAAVPIKNPKTHGCPKGTISLRVKRRERRAKQFAAQQSVESPYHPMVAYPRAVKQGHFDYPKELLLQRCICGGGPGVWRVPTLRPSALVYEKFISPTKALLEQLESEGHDVSAAKLEWLALRDAANYLKDLGIKLVAGVSPQSVDQESWDFDEVP